MVSYRLQAPWIAVLLLIVGCPAKHGDRVDYCAEYDASDPIPSDWVFIEGGTFEMGSPAWEGEPDEHPMHTVTVPSFEMWQSEVTVEQYARCHCAGQCNLPRHCDFPPQQYWGIPGSESHPITCISRERAAGFCEWVGGRLPSEAEWEYAARSGGQDITYPWGDEEPTCTTSWYGGCGDTGAVCTLPEGYTDQGLCDMSGNVAEWVHDIYHDSYWGAPTDGSAWGTPPEDGYGVVRGGGFSNYPEYVYASRRERCLVGGCSDSGQEGARCAR